MWGILEASQNTLEDISLPFNTDDEESCHRLWRMRFPQLRSLIFGVWLLEEPESLDEFTDFIVAHNETLEHLELGYDAYSGDILSYNGSTHLRADSLPKLRSFSGHAIAVQQMAETRMECLTTTLHRLEVGPGDVDEPK